MKAGDKFTDENGVKWQIEYVGKDNVKLRGTGYATKVAWLPKDLVEEMLNTIKG